MSEIIVQVCKGMGEIHIKPALPCGPKVQIMQYDGGQYDPAIYVDLDRIPAFCAALLRYYDRAVIDAPDEGEKEMK